MNFQFVKALKVLAVVLAIFLAAFAVGAMRGVNVSEVREEVKL